MTITKEKLVEISRSKKKVSALTVLTALRPNQWTKNLIVFAAPLFAFKLHWQSIGDSLIAFLLFCCLSSAFYIFNDVIDIQSDRLHPVKCQRPIAAGLVSVPLALGVAIFLLLGSLIIGGLKAPLLGMILLSYAILQIAYNLRLKHKPIVDIIAIAAGFILRACGGAAVCKVTISPWFLLCTAMLALFLGIEKRKAELRLLPRVGGTTRSVLRRYSLSLLTRMESVVTNGVLICYALWSAGPIVKGASSSWMMLTFPFVLYGIFRYQLLSEPNCIDFEVDRNKQSELRTERPEEILLHDRPMIFTILIWLISTIVILWLQKYGKLVYF